MSIEELYIEYDLEQLYNNVYKTMHVIGSYNWLFSYTGCKPE